MAPSPLQDILNATPPTETLRNILSEMVESARDKQCLSLIESAIPTPQNLPFGNSLLASGPQQSGPCSPGRAQYVQKVLAVRRGSGLPWQRGKHLPRLLQSLFENKAIRQVGSSTALL